MFHAAFILFYFTCTHGFRWAGQQRTNPFAASRDDKTAMRPFAKLLWTLVQFSVRWITIGI